MKVLLNGKRLQMHGEKSVKNLLTDDEVKSPDNNAVHHMTANS